MNISSAVLIGIVVGDLRHEQTDGGFGVCRFRMAVNERVFDRKTDRYLDAQPSYYTVVCRRQLARNVYRSIRRGDPVVVSGRLRVREWKSADGRGGAVTEVSAIAVGHNLARGQAKFEPSFQPTKRHSQSGDREAASAAA